MKYEIFAYDNWDKFFAADFKDVLDTSGNKATIVPKQRFSLDGVDPGEMMGYIKRAIVIRNLDTKLFYILNHDDDETLRRPRKLLTHPSCGGVLQCQYRHHELVESSGKIHPYTYRPKDSVMYEPIRASLCDTPKTLDTLLFRGAVSLKDGRRERAAVMKALQSHMPAADRILPQQYYAELASTKLALSLPGNGNFCHREIECFGLKTPVIMPRLLNSFYNNLIPDYHYVSVDVGWAKDTPEVKAAAIVDRFENTINRDEYLKFVASNAYTWYVENVACPSNVFLGIRILGLNGTI